MIPETDVTLHDLLLDVYREWEFTSENYPELAHLHGEARLKFIRDHLVKHLQKILGKLAELYEPLDHGRSLPEDYNDQIRIILGKALATLLQLANIEGLQDFDLERAVQSVVHS